MTEREFVKEFKALYLPLGMYALRIVNDAMAAQDCVQNAFMHAWEALLADKKIINFSSYMYRSVHNSCLDYLRSLHENDNLPDIAEPTEEDEDTSRRDAALWHAIDRLPQRCRQVFLLSKRDGLSQEEIAHQMGISIKTVKNQMSKAYERLREALSASGDDALPSVLLLF